MKPYSVLVYISGKITEDSVAKQLENIDYANSVNKRLWGLGFVTICPHTNTPQSANISYDDFMAGDIELLKRCDCVLMLDNWEQSKGAAIELAFADKIGLPVFFSIEELCNHYREK